MTMNSFYATMPTYQSLSIVQKLRISRLITIGKAPPDPRSAAAAVELAEYYQQLNRITAAFVRWLPLCIVLGLGYVAVPRAIDGEYVMGALFALVVCCSVGQFMLNPATRPKNLARSLEASRRVAGTEC